MCPWLYLLHGFSSSFSPGWHFWTTQKLSHSTLQFPSAVGRYVVIVADPDDWDETEDCDGECHVVVEIKLSNSYEYIEDETEEDDDYGDESCGEGDQWGGR